MLNNVCTLRMHGATLLHLWLSPASDCDCPTVCGRLSAPLSWIWVITLGHGQGPKFRTVSRSHSSSSMCYVITNNATPSLVWTEALGVNISKSGIYTLPLWSLLNCKQ